MRFDTTTYSGYDDYIHTLKFVHILYKLDIAQDYAIDTDDSGVHRKILVV